jgi:hypothetical protein
MAPSQPTPPTSNSNAKGKDRLPDYVRDSLLKTEFRKGITIHSYEISDPLAGRRQEIQRVRWGKGKLVGRGGFGDVLKQKRIGDVAIQGHPEVRAVKRIALGSKRISHKDYVRELETIAKFSQTRVGSFRTFCDRA